MFKALTSALLLRRTVAALDRIAATLDRQAAALDRLTDRFAPALPLDDSTATRARIRRDTGLSHVDPDDLAAALAYVTRTEADTGHTPDEEEIMLHLGDERTRDLAERLTSREDDLARLAEARR
jgi:hypothetical protein